MYMEHMEFMWTTATTELEKWLSRVTKLNSQISPENLVTELEIVILIVTCEYNSLCNTLSVAHFEVIYLPVK